MAVKCGWAAISEYGSVNGKKGDQTGGEVRVGNWYYFGQNVVLRFKDRERAKKAAKYMREIAANNNVGYGQADRTSLYTAWRAVGWSHPEKITTKCNTDCSQLVATICIAVGYATVSPNNWTGSLKAALVKTGGFEVLTASKYLTKDTYLLTGDIILNEATHVIMALEDGSAAPKPTKTVADVAKEVVAGKWGTGAERKARLEKAGYNYAKVQAEVNKLLAAKKKKTADELAREIIAGKWGVGATRIAKLKKAGYTTTEIARAQKRVNELLKG